MDEFEAAFYYGDFSPLRDLITKLLYENTNDTSPQ